MHPSQAVLSSSQMAAAEGLVPVRDRSPLTTPLNHAQGVGVKTIAISLISHT